MRIAHYLLGDILIVRVVEHGHTYVLRGRVSLGCQQVESILNNCPPGGPQYAATQHFYQFINKH